MYGWFFICQIRRMQEMLIKMQKEMENQKQKQQPPAPVARPQQNGDVKSHNV